MSYSNREYQMDSIAIHPVAIDATAATGVKINCFPLPPLGTVEILKVGILYDSATDTAGSGHMTTAGAFQFRKNTAAGAATTVLATVTVEAGKAIGYIKESADLNATTSSGSIGASTLDTERNYPTLDLDDGQYLDLNLSTQGVEAGSGVQSLKPYVVFRRLPDLG